MECRNAWCLLTAMDIFVPRADDLPLNTRIPGERLLSISPRLNIYVRLISERMFTFSQFQSEYLRSINSGVNICLPIESLRHEFIKFVIVFVELDDRRRMWLMRGTSV